MNKTTANTAATTATANTAPERSYTLRYPRSIDSDALERASLAAKTLVAEVRLGDAVESGRLPRLGLAARGARGGPVTAFENGTFCHSVVIHGTFIYAGDESYEILIDTATGVVVEHNHWLGEDLKVRPIVPADWAYIMDYIGPRARYKNDL